MYIHTVSSGESVHPVGCISIQFIHLRLECGQRRLEQFDKLCESRKNRAKSEKTAPQR